MESQLVAAFQGKSIVETQQSIDIGLQDMHHERALRTRPERIARCNNTQAAWGEAQIYAGRALKVENLPHSGMESRVLGQLTVVCEKALVGE